MDKCEHKLRQLPDIEMYGGSTIPWVVSMMHEDGTQYKSSEASELTSTLTVSTYAVTSGTVAGASDVMPIIKIDATISADTDGCAIATFQFTNDDTINLRGKFIYQIEFKSSSDVRVCQGYLYIRQNINRSSGD